MMDGEGGAVDGEGRALPAWVGAFLRDHDRADVLRKLTVEAPSREVFIAADLNGAPWPVVSYLIEMSSLEWTTPRDAPDLPDPITGVWVSSTVTFGDGVGVRWDGDRWSTFRSRGNGIDAELRE